MTLNIVFLDRDTLPPETVLRRPEFNHHWTEHDRTALNGGLIAGAAIDVLPTEPPADDHPFFALMDRPDFILTPHVAWASREAIQTLADQLMDTIEAFVAGAPRNVV